jgi:hypothetical protein
MDALDITQADIDAGADGVMEAANEAGFGSWINRDQAKGLAVKVLTKVKEYREEPAPISIGVTLEPEHADDMAVHATGFFASILSLLHHKVART